MRRFAIPLVLLYLFPIQAFTSVYTPPLESDWYSLIEQFNSQHAISLTVAALLLMRFSFLILRTVIGDMLGIYKYLVLACLAPFAMISVNLLTGKSVAESIFGDSATLFSYQIAIDQLFRQWRKRNADASDLAAKQFVRETHIARGLPVEPNRPKLFYRRNYRQR